MSGARPIPLRPVRTVLPSDVRRGTVVRALLVLASLIVGTMLVLVRDTLLPARFSYDAAEIQSIGQGTNHVTDPAFTSVAAVYRALGLVDAPVAASLLGFFAAFAVLLVAARRLVRPGAPASAIVLFLVAVMLSAVYLGTYSKDVFLLPIALIAVLPGGRRLWPVLTGVAALAYAVEFRTYWVVVVALWAGLQFVLLKRPRAGWLLAALVVAAALLALAIGIGTGGSADAFRLTTNEGRLGTADAASAITPFLPGNTVLTGVLNTPLTLLALLLPLPLALKGGAYFAGLAALLAAFWVRTAVAVQRSLQGRPDAAERSRIALLLAFVVVQAVFEPDYGSALRHLTPLLPIAVLLWSVPRRSAERLPAPVVAAAAG